jgi:hypothetical protein
MLSYRFAGEDITMHGKTIRRGEMMFFLLVLPILILISSLNLKYWILLAKRMNIWLLAKVSIIV